MTHGFLRGKAKAGRKRGGVRKNSCSPKEGHEGRPKEKTLHKKRTAHGERASVVVKAELGRGLPGKVQIMFGGGEEFMATS